MNLNEQSTTGPARVKIFHFRFHDIDFFKNRSKMILKFGISEKHTKFAQSSSWFGYLLSILKWQFWSFSRTEFGATGGPFRKPLIPLKCVKPMLFWRLWGLWMRLGHFLDLKVRLPRRIQILTLWCWSTRSSDCLIKSFSILKALIVVVPLRVSPKCE